MVAAIYSVRPFVAAGRNRTFVHGTILASACFDVVTAINGALS